MRTKRETEAFLPHREFYGERNGKSLNMTIPDTVTVEKL